MATRTDTRARLVETAAELWYAKSYADVGVSEICSRAGVQKGSFYHFFPSKRDVALAVLDGYWEKVRQRVLGPALANDVPPLDRLVRLTEVHFELQSEMQAQTGTVNGCPVGNLALELSTQDEAVRQRCAGLFDDWAGLIEPVLVEAMASGDLPSVDTARAAKAVAAYVEGMLLLAKTHNDAGVIREIGPGIRQLVMGFALDEEAAA